MRGPEDERARDRHPLALAARQLVGVAEPEARPEPDLVERALDAAVGLAAPRQPVDGEGLHEHPVHGVARVERAVRVLEDHLADAREAAGRDAVLASRRPR